MKKFIVTLATVALVFALPSCKKCTTCKITYTDGDPTYTYGEICGKKTVRDAQESSCQLSASASGGTCTCDKS
ncbi:MAG: hypothetical protein KBA60_07995 [Flavobacteriales bacterium]|nr:hypothetical protein [Flavobacteriales bacterium]MBP6641693.1 hypothetical protein [Flavobacteriales bacterium]MBP7155933.1 hypothetical protein [Flavobacteriales bacterium]HQV75529.1 hypothetical protein [Flavobacteriales bacterium]HQW40995.1 hypothetical protein [Flavobacteriales bacterium]